MRKYLFRDDGSNTPGFFSQVDIKVFFKGNLYCYVDSAAREILVLCVCEREGEKEKEKKREEV